MLKRSLFRENLQVLEKCGETSGRSRNFENGDGGRSFEKERNRLAEVMPEVGAFGFAESGELRVIAVGRRSEAVKFPGGALADFGSAFHAHAKVPEIGEELSLKCGGWRFG